MEIEAVSLGIKSLGLGQIRGNGKLFIGDKEIVFKQYLPDKKIVIPFSSIFEVSTPYFFLGKTFFKKLLRVDFLNDNGELDATAWLVKDIEKVLNLVACKVD